MLISSLSNQRGRLQRAFMCQSSYKRSFMNLPRSGEYNAEDVGEEIKERSSGSIDGYSDEVSELIHNYSKKVQTSASLQILMRTGRGELLKDPATPILNTTATERILCQVASFIHHEMPIRLARRIKDLDQIPGMKDMTSVQAVKDIYISSFLSLIKEPAIQDDVVREALFARKLEVLYERHSAVLVQMAKGAYELRSQIQDSGGLNKKHDTLDFEHWQECHSFLDRFYMSRIGIRVLAGQYLALRRPPMENYIGLICQTTSPHQVVQLAVDDASYMCHSHFGAAPQVRIHGCLDMTFAYIPTQLHYILLELLKNAMRATVEHHGAQNITSWPPIQVIISDGQDNEDVVIKVVDEGGGIPRSNTKKIWSYLFTTADPSIQESLVGQSDEVDHSVEAPLAGLGYGLPISKSYARYFGGDVSIMSMEGYGTDAFVYLRRLGDSREPLPV